MQAPNKILLSQQIANTLEKAIRAGKWGEVLPGYRKLREDFGVSPRTIHEALAILTRREVLLQAESTKPRRVNPNVLESVGAEEGRNSLLILSEREIQEHGVLMRSIIERVSALFSRKGWSIAHANTLDYYKSSKSPQLKRLKKEYPHHRWLLVKPSADLVDWAQQNQLRVICVGGECGTLGAPIVTVDEVALIEDSISRLSSMGHCRISLLRNFTNEKEREALSLQLSSVMDTFQIEYHPLFHFPLLQSRSASSLWEVLTQLFEHSPPTALIVTNNQQLITVYSFCLKRGYRIPEDVSVVMTQRSKNLDWFHPRPAHFSHPPSQYVARVCRWIENYPINGQRPVYVTPEFHPEHSISVRK